MTSKQITLQAYPDAIALHYVAGKRPKFPRSMMRSAPRRHILRKKYARYLKNKWRYVVVRTENNLLAVGETEVMAWQKAAAWL